jgi:hypothetical protein
LRELRFPFVFLANYGPHEKEYGDKRVGVVAGKALSSSFSLDCDCEWFVVEEKPFFLFRRF